ncbi:MAG: sodium:solute symporter family protein [Sumerlaeia bacterium]
MTVEIWTYIFVGLTFALYLGVGWWSRVRESSGFFVAGRGVPAVANGMATASDWMSAASFMGMAGLISFMGSDGSMFLMGWTGGYVLLALLLAPYLRKFGKYTVPDFIGDRYYSTSARLVAVVCAIFVSITYVAGQMQGVGIVFSRFLGVSVNAGVVIGMFVVAFFAVLGGMKGITWTQVVQYMVLIMAYMIPAFALAFLLTGNPIPQLALPFSDIASRLDGLSTELGFDAYTQPFAGGRNKLDVLFITISLMVGTAGLPHVIVRFYTTKTVKAARASAFWALIFIAILYTTAPALAMMARYNFLDKINGMPHAVEQQPDWARKWAEADLLAFEDKNGDGIVQYVAGDANEVTNFNRDIVVLAAPEVTGLPDWVVALVAAGALAAALSTASGLLLVISSAVAHDVYFRMLNPVAPEKTRVLVGRIMVLVGVLVAGYFGINPPGYVAETVALAFGFAAASFFPAILLGIFSTRTNREGAIAGMLSGLGFVLLYIVLVKSETMGKVFGISTIGIGTVGMAINFAVTFIVSRLTAPPPADVQELVLSIRAMEDPVHPDHVKETDRDEALEEL